MAFTKQSFTAFTQTLKATVSQNATLAKQQIAQLVADEKQRVQAEARARSPERPTLTQIVDGKREAPVSTVKPDGRVILEWGYVAEAAAAVVETIKDFSPDLTGTYDEKIAIFVGETEDRGALSDITAETQSVTIGSTVPYSRRLEVGKTRAGDPFVINADDFEFVKKAGIVLRRRYREIADITQTSFQLPSTEALTYPALKVRNVQ